MDEPRICPIPEEVINLIAAGEVIHRPVNVVKELLENSLDAKADKILIFIQDKGCTIKIRDNGTGISKEDMPIVCKRFTSSKLTCIEDLTRLNTYGFRGEALCSISQVANVTISSKKANSRLGYEAVYVKGEMKSCKQIARDNGTVLTISDLFHNMPERKADIEAKCRVEYNKIVDVVRKYAIHCDHVSINLESCFSKFPDVETKNENTIFEKISAFYGKKISENLIKVQHQNATFNFKFEGLVNNTNSVLNKYVFILFINRRLVDCELLKKKLLDIYTAKLMKGYFPFIFLSIQINPQDIDVNRHPSKREVRYLHEEYINEKIREVIEGHLVSDSGTRNMQLEVAKPKFVDIVAKQNANKTISNTPNLNDKSIGKQADVSVRKKIEPWKMVRNDPKTKSIREAFKHLEANERKVNPNGTNVIMLQSVKSLISLKNRSLDAQLTEVIRWSTYVGIIDNYYLLLQYETKLILFRYKELCHQLFFQLYLENFGNFSKIRLGNAINLHSLLKLFRQTELTESQQADNFDDDWIREINEKAEMFDDYFSIEYDPHTGNIHTLPVLIQGHVPNLNLLPLFASNLHKINWKSEKACFYSFGQVLAEYYSLPLADSDKMRQITETYVFPKIKEFLKPSKEMNEISRKLADLSDLYKVFERC